MWTMFCTLLWTLPWLPACYVLSYFACSVPLGLWLKKCFCLIIFLPFISSICLLRSSTRPAHFSRLRKHKRVHEHIHTISGCICTSVCISTFLCVSHCPPLSMSLFLSFISLSHFYAPSFSLFLTLSLCPSFFFSLSLFLSLILSLSLSIALTHLSPSLSHFYSARLILACSCTRPSIGGHSQALSLPGRTAREPLPRNDSIFLLA